MTIPFDGEHRWWIDVSSANPAEVDRLSPSLVGFLAFGPGKEPRFAGTGFIIAGNNDMALVISAKHVFSEGVVRAQTPVPRHAPSSPFVVRSAILPSLDPRKLKAVWAGPQHGKMLNAHLVDFNDVLDTSCALLMPQEGEATGFSIAAVPLDTTLPEVGDVVHMVSLGGLNAVEIVEPADASGQGQAVVVHRRIGIRIGVVTGTYPKGLRHYCWPCFTTSIPAEPGMSGGFVTLPKEGKTIAACGIVCADASTTTAQTNFYECGESIVAYAWPSLSHRPPLEIPPAPDTPLCSLYEMMRNGQMPIAIGGIDRIAYQYLGNGEAQIGYL
jgi:hypothetical protein